MVFGVRALHGLASLKAFGVQSVRLGDEIRAKIGQLFLAHPRVGSM